MAEKIVSSDQRKINKSASYLFDFLSDFRNFISILPADRIEKWECDENSCTFTIIGLARLSFFIAEKKPTTQIVYQSNTLETMPITLIVNFTEIDASNTIAQIDLKTTMSGVVFMFAEKQLKNLVEKMTEKMIDL